MKPQQTVPLDANLLVLPNREAVHHDHLVSLLFTHRADQPPRILAGRSSWRNSVSSFRVPGKTLTNRPPLACDIVHVLRGGQLAVGHVQEIVTPRQLAEQVPGFPVRLIVGHVAAGRLEVDRHPAVVTDRQDIK